MGRQDAMFVHQLPEAAQEGAFDCSDQGNAHRIAHYWPREIRHVGGLKGDAWAVWDSKRWRLGSAATPAARGIVHRLGQEIRVSELPPVIAAGTEWADRAEALWYWSRECGMSRRIDAAMRELAPLVQIEMDAFDQWPFLLGTPTGTVDLHTGEMREPQPGDFLTKLTNAEYEPGAECPTWDRVMSEWLPDADERAFVRQVVGMAVVGEVRDHILTVMYGEGRNGKTIFVETLHAILGDYSQVLSADVLMAGATSDGSAPNPEVASLRGRRFVAASESSSTQRLNQAKVKYLVGGDTITAAFKHQNPISFTPTHNVILITNHMPRVSDDAGESLWSKVALVHWSESFLGKEDTTLKAKLANEAPGILRWVVDAAREYLEAGLQMPDSIRASTDAYRAEQDHLGRWIRERCQINANAPGTMAAVLYRDYRRHMEGLGESPITLAAWGNELRRVHGWEKKRTNSGVLYPGIMLRREDGDYDH